MLRPLTLVCLFTAAAAAQPAAEPPSDPPLVQPTMVQAPAQESLTLSAQAKPVAQNSLYLELGGTSMFYSLNYERFVTPEVAIRVGFSYMSISATAGSGMNQENASASWLTIPIMAEYLGIHNGAHALELGAGMDMMYFSGSASTFDDSAMASGVLPVGAANIGYRYSDPKGGFIFRASYTPLFVITSSTKEVFHWAGLSFGYRF
jgi:hypothetical protein